MVKRAVVLLSGGLDSATAAAVAKAQGYELHALSFDYGQRHRKELASARKVAKFLNMSEHRILKLGLSELGGSSLTDRRIPVPRKKGAWRSSRSGPHSAQKGPGAIPSTYVPARNIIFIAFAAAYAETVDADAIFIGANAVDFSGYPDCRPEFLRAFERTLRAGTKRGTEGRPLRLIAPLLRLTKAEIIRRGARLGVPFGLTWSCYTGGKEPCGECDSCRIRAKGFREAGAADPLLARSKSKGDAR